MVSRFSLDEVERKMLEILSKKKLIPKYKLLKSLVRQEYQRYKQEKLKQQEENKNETI